MDQDAIWHEGMLSPGHILLDGDPAPPPRKWEHSPRPNFRPMSIVASGRPSQLLLCTCTVCIRETLGLRFDMPSIRRILID